LGTSFDPMSPVPPITTIFMVSPQIRPGNGLGLRKLRVVPLRVNLSAIYDRAIAALWKMMMKTLAHGQESLRSRQGAVLVLAFADGNRVRAGNTNIT